MPDASVGRPVAECADSDTASNSVSYLSVSGYNPAVNPALLTEIILQL
jgi:hypothetical protein